MAGRPDPVTGVRLRRVLPHLHPSERPELVNNIPEQLDSHPLSITLLVTAAHRNKWDTNRLAGEWSERQTGVLHIEHNESFAATIELLLSSPIFKRLGPDARGLLEVITFPQRVDEKNLDWLFPTITNRESVFDKFCARSLTCRGDGFVTMLTPLRHYLYPKDLPPASLLFSTKECHLSRLSATITPANFEGARWVVSEDVNAENLLNVFIAIDAASGSV